MGVPNGVVSKQCYEMVLINLYELSGEGRGGGMGGKTLPKGEEIGNPIITIKKKKKEKRCKRT